jgi:hypothetical protein
MLAATACGSAEPGAGNPAPSTEVSGPISGGIRIPPPSPQFDSDSIVGFKNVPAGSVVETTFLVGPLVVPEKYSASLTTEFVSDANDTVILRYSDPKTFGTFWLSESALPDPDYSQADIVTLSQICTDCTEKGLVPVSPTIDGALLAGPPATSITWLQNGNRFRVIGPDDTFSVKTATAVAMSVAEAAQSQSGQ